MMLYIGIKTKIPFIPPLLPVAYNLAQDARRTALCLRRAKMKSPDFNI
jgi:hypothetical protein